jgi:hypothetical protein
MMAEGHREAPPSVIEPGKRGGIVKRQSERQRQNEKDSCSPSGQAIALTGLLSARRGGGARKVGIFLVSAGGCRVRRPAAGRPTEEDRHNA